MQKVLHAEEQHGGAQEDAHRRETLRVQLEGLRLEVRQVGRADPSLQEAHGGQAVPVQDVREGLLPVRPPGAAPEEA